MNNMLYQKGILTVEAIKFTIIGTIWKHPKHNQSTK